MVFHLKRNSIREEVITQNSKKDTENKKSGDGDLSRRICDHNTRHFIYSL